MENYTDDVYRSCFDGDGKNVNCPYVRFNEYNISYCSIDGIIQIRWYGCTPQYIKKRMNKN